MSWPAAFALTLAVELPIVFWLAGTPARRRALADAFAANLLTHPLAWWLIRSLLWPWAAVEVGVALTEAVVYRAATGLAWPRALLTSACANGVTAALSFVV